MDCVVKGLCKVRWQTQLQFVRFNNKINVTKPRAPHFEKALMETLCLPYFNVKKKPKHIPDYESCGTQPELKSKNVEDHPLVAILAEENLNYLKNSKLTAFFHVNCLAPEEKFSAQLLFKNSGMKLLFPNLVVMKKAVAGTPYEVILDLFEAPTATVICPEPNIHELMSIHKKASKLALMCAIVDNRLLSLTDLKTYSTLKSVTEARLGLLSTLNSASQRLVQQINQQPTNLVGLLDQHKKILEDGKS